MDPIMIAILVAAGVCVLAALLYGIFRKFTQMSWLSWQILVLFAATLPLKSLTETLQGTQKFTVGLIFVVGAVALVIGGGALIRFFMLKRTKPAPGIFRFFNRLLGAITAILNFAVFALFFATLALPVIYYGVPQLNEVLGVVFEQPVWTNFLAVHALDFALITIFALSIRAGWRVGFLRTLLIWLMLALSVGAVALSIYLTVSVPFFSGMAASMGGGINTGNATINGAIGSGIMFLIIFVVVFIVLCIVGYFLAKLVRLVRYNYVFGFIDGAIGVAFGLAIATACVLGIYYLLMWLGGGNATELITNMLSGMEFATQYAEQIAGILEPVTEYAHGVALAFASSPLSALFFYGNPLAAGLTFVA